LPVSSTARSKRRWMVPFLAVQLRMNPKSVPEPVVAEPAAGRPAGWAVVGFEGVARPRAMRRWLLPVPES
jgi:hypothetical protein